MEAADGRHYAVGQMAVTAKTTQDYLNVAADMLDQQAARLRAGDMSVERMPE
jgi:hypothetical protein